MSTESVPSPVAASGTETRAAAPKPRSFGGPGGPGGGRRGPGGRDGRGPRRDASPKSDGPEMIEKIVFINRCAKVVKGGRRFSFSALAVVGDRARRAVTAVFAVDTIGPRRGGSVGAADRERAVYVLEHRA